MIALLVLGVLPLLIWIGLIVGHGGFWLCGERDDKNAPPEPDQWPSVIAVVPARDEADVIARSIGSLLTQDYPGDFRVILVDDNSGDGTAEAARAEAERLGRQDRLAVLSGARGRLDRQAMGGEPGRGAGHGRSAQIPVADRRGHRP